MRKRLALLTLVLLLIGGAVGGTVAWADLGANRNEIPKGVLSVAELLENPVYDTEVTIQGEVTLLGELFCPCFVLVSGGETIQVWYGLMVEDDGTEKPPVSVEGIENGDWVVITGEVKQAGQHTALNDFWATSIEKGEAQIVGGTPGSCGYVWDAERGGWHRPWDPDSFIPAGDKPEWDKFIQMSEEESQKIAEEFLRDSPTFRFDGIVGSVKLVETLTMRCPYCWAFIFEFQTRHAGHGDRTGAIQAQVITTHRAVITVQEGEVVSALCCENWDMMPQSSIEAESAVHEEHYFIR